ncbi:MULTISPECIES: phage/plasmid replication protein, II/X family [Burkholderia]|uniref:phage/plasmid replication protein, II/X family n=1 Tax=Burkholderia TaxID=32008 RepID=UPI000F1A48BF|nr:phage/plasmid replication protein, II/X family [Burkholderia pseudomallei]VBG08341.1 phage/plasmid replication protein, gene II/X family [Burkholderia pseudomallei]
MIDLIDIKIQLQHKPFGSERLKLTENSPFSPPTSKRFSKKIALQPGGPLIDVTSLDNGSVIHIRDCPLTPLQGHNVFGSDDVCLLGSTLICAVLDRLSIAYADEQRRAWEAGEFVVDALDITHRFALPENLSQKQIFDHIRTKAAWKFRPGVISAGTGVRMAAPRHSASWVFYDKRQKLLDKRTRSLKHLRAVVGEEAHTIWRGLQSAASNSIRAELKLSKKYLEDRKLNRGSAWTIEKVHEVYWVEMEKLRFEAHVPLRQLGHSINKVRIRQLRHMLELWARGAELDKLYPESTFDRHRSRIRHLTGIDILLDVPMVAALPLSEIFCRENLRKEFPQWARTFPACAFGIAITAEAQTEVSGPSARDRELSSATIMQHRLSYLDSGAAKLATTSQTCMRGIHVDRFLQRPG